MGNNYKDLNVRVNSRLNPDGAPITKSFSDELSYGGGDVEEYVRNAMMEVDSTYTNISMQAVDAVKNHLSHIPSIEFELQGSVMTNTHIKGYSDIDLLVLSRDFHVAKTTELKNTLSKLPLNQVEKRKLINAELDLPAYKGNAVNHLLDLRQKCESILLNKYSECDTNKDKSISIFNKSYKRNVDVVIANYIDDSRSVLNLKGVFRGVQVYNKRLNTKGLMTFPFLSIKFINNKSAETNGRLKRMIRFLKQLKAEFNIDLSSFEINAIVYSIPSKVYNNLHYVDLVEVLYAEIYKLLQNAQQANDLQCITDNEYIFRDKPNKIEALKGLFSEVAKIYNDLNNNIRRVA